MARVQHILFPYDFSLQGQRTVPFVRALAGAAGARVTVLSVVPPLFERMPSGMSVELPPSVDITVLKASLQQRLDDALGEDLAGLRVERVAEAGDAAIRITDFALSHDVDLIMMPTHGMGLFRSLLIGSVTSKVLHDATCAVWTAAHAEVQAAAELPRTILCAVSGAAGTTAQLQYARDVAADVHATLKVLHVVGPVSDWPALASERRLQEQVRETAEAAMARSMASAGITVPYRVVIGDIVQTTTEQARQDGADLVIIGRGMVAQPFGRLRTHAFGIIHQAPCPVLSV